MIPTEPGRENELKVGPKTAPASGRQRRSASVGPYKPHAARSARILERRYASNWGSSGSAQTVSSLTRSVSNGGRAAAAAEVMTTRSTPAATAEPNTRRVPPRAGPTSASGSRSLPPPSGDATWRTNLQPSMAASQPTSDVRSARANVRSQSSPNPARVIAARTSLSPLSERTVARTEYPYRSKRSMHHPATKPVPPVTRTVSLKLSLPLAGTTGS